jgi:hypothetical protein
MTEGRMMLGAETIGMFAPLSLTDKTEGSIQKSVYERFYRMCWTQM